ncbi:iron-sulfur cluster repair di-iron protein [Flavobacterium sedimenticola]|uniref:Iron-sulfur cluster repair di-iron protein n=1 Tax=Flavobacterium sedimenticola TaxID=3043286 RepID=A0ABT6XNJ8_9FLAO|nr:iron-sulfur cluster repair di-iron protein [Flavobacterium sedimenticola]MDI9256249.1 iron-sulfur cluster repair di-iron protein [Flavobacterium sedimenticola]
MNALDQITVGEFVAGDFRTAAVFSKYGIDFCCKGNRTLDEVCEKKGLNVHTIQDELMAVLESKSDNNIDFKSWPIDLLIDYIEKTHHRYVEEKSTALLFYLDKLCKVHGQRHPELFEIALHFKICAGELAQHMKKEELILFPFVKKMYYALTENTAIEQPHFGTVDNPIAMMQSEHENEGERFRLIAKLTDDYNPPADACETYRVTFAMLKEFEQDLHKHIHLENNIVFPKAQAMEAKFNIA